MKRLREDPGLVLAIVAVVAAIALYAPTLARALVNYDDPWLVRDNWIVRDASLSAIWFDLSADTRFVLGAEYLPVRDMSVVLDHALWGTWYGGHHLTNVVVYASAIVLWFAAICAFGVDRRIAGVMMLLWALHPSHAESVAWLSERKGLLGVMFAGAAALGFARYRAGARAGWLAMAALAAVCAVWSKAPSAFAVAALGALELVLPARRMSWRRSAVALAIVGVVTAVAFVPVLVVATQRAVVGTTDHAPAGWLAMALGVHGFYVQLGALAVQNAPSYPIASVGPTALDIAIGSVALALAIACLRGRVPAELRAGAVLWLFGWFPASRLVLPLRNVLVADRYLLLPTLGLALVLATAIAKVPTRRARIALVTVLALACGLRALDAQGTWEDSETLWQRATESNPHDGDAWSLYAEAVHEQRRPDVAFAVLRDALAATDSPRVKLRVALLVLDYGQRSVALRHMREAAEAGEYRAMANLALLLHQDGAHDEALAWARRAVAAAPQYANGQRVLGKVALALGHTPEALAAFERAYALERTNLANRFNLAIALRAAGRVAEARVHFEACLADPKLGPQARAALAAP